MKRHIIFRHLDAAFSRLYSLKFLFKSVGIFKFYAKKQKGLFLSVFTYLLTRLVNFG